MRLGLLTGRRIERPSASGVRPGLEFRAAIVVTVRFEGIVRDAVTKKFSLRDPKIVLIRADKTAFEVDEASMLEKLYLDQRLK
jgi:DNA ligase-1